MVNTSRKNLFPESLSSAAGNVKREPEPDRFITGFIKGIAEEPPEGQVILAGVSGGADSVALLRILAAAAPLKGWRIVVGHVDHQLRSDSAKDAEFVGKLARDLGLEFIMRKVNPDKNGVSPEEAARDARRAALLKMAEKAGAQTVALAHTADDQAETLTARFFSGTGPTGLAGMRKKSGITWRPLLDVTRAELVEYLEHIGQNWREDPTNQELVFERNRVRLKILPMVKELLNPRAHEAVNRLAGLCGREEDYWRLWCETALVENACSEGSSLFIKSAFLDSLHQAQAARLLRHAVGLITGRGQHLSALHLESLLDLVRGEAGRRLEIRSLMWACKEPKGLRLDRAEKPPEFTTVFHGPGCLFLPHLGKTLVMEKVTEIKELKARGPEGFIPWPEVVWPVKVGPAENGLRIHPLGGPGAKKLNRFLMDLKVPLWGRRRTLIVSDQKGLLWAAPWSLDERARKKGDEDAWLRLVLIDTPYKRQYTKLSVRRTT